MLWSSFFLLDACVRAVTSDMIFKNKILKNIEEKIVHSVKNTEGWDINRNEPDGGEVATQYVIRVAKYNMLSEFLNLRKDTVFLTSDSIDKSLLCGREKSGGPFYKLKFDELYAPFGITVMAFPYVGSKSRYHVPNYQIQVQGRYFSNPDIQEFLPYDEILMMAGDYRISRYDLALDYLGDYFSNEKLQGTISSWKAGQKDSGWSHRGDYYRHRNYNKTTETRGKINDFYDLRYKYPVLRLEVELKSRSIVTRKIQCSHEACHNLALKQISRFWKDLVVSGDIPKQKKRPSTIENRLLYWERQILKAEKRRDSILSEKEKLKNGYRQLDLFQRPIKK